MEYVDYQFYQEKYLLGKEAMIDSASFAYYESRAVDAIRQRTLNRSDLFIGTNEVKLCVCAIAESLFEEEKSNKEISAETVGPHSVTYKTKDQKQFASEREAIFRKYLLYLNLLSRKIY